MSEGVAEHLRPGTQDQPLCNALRRLLDLSCVRGIQADAADPRRLLNQIVGHASSIARHYRTGSQCKSQRVGLILKIQNDLPGHRILPEFGLLATAFWKDLRRWRADERVFGSSFLRFSGKYVPAQSAFLGSGHARGTFVYEKLVGTGRVELPTPRTPSGSEGSNPRSA